MLRGLRGGPFRLRRHRRGAPGGVRVRHRLILTARLEADDESAVESADDVARDSEAGGRHNLQGGWLAGLCCSNKASIRLRQFGHYGMRTRRHDMAIARCDMAAAQELIKTHARRSPPCEKGEPAPGAKASRLSGGRQGRGYRHAW
eukprot:1190213-Prorocentrum_minimum.AAC.2